MEGQFKAGVIGLTCSFTVSAANVRCCFAVRCGALVEGAPCVPTWQRIRLSEFKKYDIPMNDFHCSHSLTNLLMLTLQGRLPPMKLKTRRRRWQMGSGKGL